MQTALNAKGQTYRDFLVTKYLPLPELQSTLIQLVHQPTGARIIHIANRDPENLFCLSFQTLPSSSNGVAHILEHTVLCGSEKYPVKDPFFAMSRRSLNTFMNALTGQDFTCYPASSQVEKDLYNLLEVYLDAVFHPELKQMSFLQEGHRLEFADPKKPESPLQFQGVVYNEMKGSLSSSDSRLWRSVFKHLMPDLPYAFNTGGDPKEIPHLTHEELIEFHRTFYHPSRCLFFFYGDIPLAKHLDFIADKTLKDAGKIAPLPPLPLQKRFSSPQAVTENYPISSAESTEKKAIVAFAWLTAPASNQEELLALTLLDSLLMDHDGSPLRQALLKSNLCTQAASSIDVELSEAPWLIVCKGCEEESKEALKERLFLTLKEIAKTPFSQELIEASIHQLEFDRTEINGDDGPFGLTLFMRSALLAQHGVDPANGLLVHTLFNDLRAKCADPMYLPHLICHYLLDNPHFVQLVLKPDPNLEKKEAEEERQTLEKIRSHLSAKEVENIIEQSAKLADYQETTEHQSLDCLPKVSLHDVSPHARDLSLTETDAGKMQVFHHECFTNHILYADLLFDLPEIAFSDLPLIPLFTHLLTEVGAGGRNYSENLTFAQAHTGGVSASLSLHIMQNDPNQCRPMFGLKGKALKRNSDKLFTLFADLIANPDFSDRSRLKELISQHVTSLQNRLTKNALNYAVQTSLSPFSIPSSIFEEWHGLSYYQAILKWAKNPERLIDELQRIAHLLLGVGIPHLVLSADASQFDEIQKEAFYGLANRLPHKKGTPWQGNYPLPKVSSQARPVAAPVAFTSLGMRTAAYKDKASPLLLLSTELLQNTILHTEIREKGGAYGASASYAPTTGNFYLYSYRDPQLAKTYATFQKALEKIGKGSFEERHLEEAKLCVLQTLDAPIIPGHRAVTAYSWKRAGRTKAVREEFRKTLLSATRKEVAEAVQKHILPQEKILVTLLGKELYEKEVEKLPHPLPLLPI